MIPSPYFYIYLAIIVMCVLLTPYVHFLLHGYRADTFIDYNTAVLNQVAGVIIGKKNDAYAFRSFYSNESVNFSEYQLVNHYLSLADIECMTSEHPFDTCSSLQVNDVSIPRTLDNPRFSRHVCSNLEYGLLDTKDNMYKVRILNYDYTFQRACINLVVNKVETVGTGVLLSVKNDLAAQLLVLLRPQFITTNMTYLYKVSYKADPFYYGPNANSPRNYSSAGVNLNLLLEKVTDDRVYATKFLVDLSDTSKINQVNKDVKCSDVKTTVQYVEQEQFVRYNTPPESFSAAFTVYHHRLMGKMSSSIDLTNSMALYFEIDLTNQEKFHSDAVLFNVMRSASGKSDVCKTMSVKMRNDSIKCVNIVLNEMSSLTYTFEFPDESRKFKMVVVYTLDLIIVCAFYMRANGVNAFKYAMYDTSVVSSWSITDIASATREYSCALPPDAAPATSYCIPTFYDMFSSMKLI